MLSLMRANRLRLEQIFHLLGARTALRWLVTAEITFTTVFRQPSPGGEQRLPRAVVRGMLKFRRAGDRDPLEVSYDSSARTRSSD
jgi:hypothetical protein